MTAVRRVKLLAIAAFTLLIIMLYYSAQTRTDRRLAQKLHNDERHRMKEAKDKGVDVEDLDIEKQLKSQRLKDAENAAKDKANAKAPNPPPGFGEGGDKAGQWDATDEIDRILKRSPIIIFSKSYCQYSMKAKKILLEKYKIVPAPYVVELDLTEHGPEIQQALGVQTKRRTVPNILVLGRSIGGGDDIAKLDEDGKLASTIMGLAGKRIQQVKKIG